MMSAVVSLSGCIIAPDGREGYQSHLEDSGCSQVDDANGTCGQKNHHHHQKTNMITRDGIMLPDCQALPDASQADNGSRCWYH